MNNYYDLLDLDSSATFQQIKQNFIRKIREAHPDKNTDKRDLAQQLIEAYSILSNQSSRAEYDKIKSQSQKDLYCLSNLKVQLVNDIIFECEQCGDDNFVPLSLIEAQHSIIECRSCNIKISIENSIT